MTRYRVTREVKQITYVNASSQEEAVELAENLGSQHWEFFPAMNLEVNEIKL